MSKTPLMGLHFNIAIQTEMKKKIASKRITLSQVHQGDKYLTFAMMFMLLL